MNVPIRGYCMRLCLFRFTLIPLPYTDPVHVLREVYLSYFSSDINVVSLVLFFIINTIDFAVAAMCDAANSLASYRNLRLTPWDFLCRESCNLKIGINHNLSISIISISLHPPLFLLG